MIHFLDGPAQGVTLAVGRAPALLRVVEPRRLFPGPWPPRDDDFDALDQDDDVAAVTEAVHVYARVGRPTYGFVDFRGAGGRRCGRRLACAAYRHLAEQPPDAVVRDNVAWLAWCAAQSNEPQPPARPAASIVAVAAPAAGLSPDQEVRS